MRAAQYSTDSDTLKWVENRKRQSGFALHVSYRRDWPRRLWEVATSRKPESYQYSRMRMRDSTFCHSKKNAIVSHRSVDGFMSLATA
jgi:hypothetical protein